MTDTRRKFLTGALTLGCSAGAFPLATPVTFAAAPGENRLVVIVLRGAMDGLAAFEPYGDRGLRNLRSTILNGADEGRDLNGFFALHPALADLAPLWAAGELAIAPAVSTPYRDRRSHFVGQDLLENGGGSSAGDLHGAGDGWLNRAISAIPGARAAMGVAIGRETPRLLTGPNETLSWAPSTDLKTAPTMSERIAALYDDDPLFHEAFASAMELDDITDGMRQGGGGRDTSRSLAAFAARMLREDARIAAFSLGGFDTHFGQKRRLNKPLAAVAEAILTLKSGLGPVWERSAILCITEFGRTARQNGSGGTDHGTGGAMIFAGGALSGARVHGRWPGLAEPDLYQNRDLTPTGDLRRYAAWALRDLFGVERAALMRDIFPGVDLGGDPRLLA